jgi:hypothetical protein
MSEPQRIEPLLVRDYVTRANRLREINRRQSSGEWPFRLLLVAALLTVAFGWVFLIGMLADWW